MMFLSRTTSVEVAVARSRATLPIGRPTFSGSVSKTAAMLIPCSAKIGELAIAWPSRPAPTSAMLCWPCVRRILRISPSSAVDVVADAALAELAEPREVAADLRRVDVRVVGDLLRGDAVLAHLLRLRQNLEVPAQPRRDAHRQPIRHRLLLASQFVTAASHSASRVPCGAPGDEPLRRRVCAADWRRKRVRLDVVDERALAVDLDDREPLAVRAPRASGSPPMSTSSSSNAELLAELGEHAPRACSQRWQPGGVVERRRAAATYG